MYLVRIFIWLLFVSTAWAQSSPGFIEGAHLCANYPNPICSNDPSPNPLSLNQAFQNKLDASTGFYSLLNPTTQPPPAIASICSSSICPDSTLPVNGLWSSGAGAIFTNCPLIGCLSGDHQRSAFYLKATATQDASIAEYMATLDCNLNSGKGGTAVGPGNFSDAKVCLFNSVTTGSNAGNATWAFANDLVIGTGDTGAFKIGVEFDIQNNGADCAIAVRNCYNIMLSGDIGPQPITAEIAIGPASIAGSASHAAHYGILINGSNVADTVDFDNSGSAPIGLCNGCLLNSTTHSTAGIREISTTPIGLQLLGTYSGAAIQIQAGAKLCFEANDVACRFWDGTNGVMSDTFTTSAPYMQIGATLTISGSGTISSSGANVACTIARTGLRSAVSNGVAGPALGSVVGTTGAIYQPVLCSGSNWVYG
jgi:hypothetical protein